jgi:hypothetical protein
LTISSSEVSVQCSLSATYEDLYAGFEDDKKMASSGVVTNGGGFCTSPVIELSGTGHIVTVRFGYTDSSTGLYGFAESGANVDLWTANKKMRTMKLGDTVKKFRVTFSSAERDNCFVYDETTDEFLFKGANVAFSDTYPGMQFGKAVDNSGNVVDNADYCVTEMYELSGTGHELTAKYDTTVVPTRNRVAGYTAEGVYVNAWDNSSDPRTFTVASTVKKVIHCVQINYVNDCYLIDNTDSDRKLWTGLNVTNNN